ncbi:hypothetical protein BIU88_11425 [Chlorobaculum limnaeum]|uniref:Uncharacterized protein n=2 Tax=Chlorobaculum limnaeum TaxID=274537 RepID=A0A1D8D8V7_CHLLM|nr:hypothetical protein BIU88_11425 [Chlorobaculum limnaeum]
MEKSKNCPFPAEEALKEHLHHSLFYSRFLYEFRSSRPEIPSPPRSKRFPIKTMTEQALIMLPLKSFYN